MKENGKGPAGLPRHFTSPADPPESPLRSAYQQLLCEAEMELTSLRTKMEVMQFKLVELETSRDHYASLFEHAPVGYIIHDGAGDIRHCNQQVLAMLGQTPKRMVGLLTAYVSPASRRGWLEHLKRCQSAAALVASDIEMRTADGHGLAVELISTPFRHARLTSTPLYHTTIINLTRRRAVQDILANTEQNFQTLVNTVQALVWEADARSLDIITVSLSAKDILGYPLSVWYQHGFWENHVHVDDRERVGNSLARLVQQRKDLDIEFRMIAADRRIIWIHSTVALRESRGKLRLFGVGIDITASKTAEEQLRSAYAELEQRVAERTSELQSTVSDLQAFSYSISHDMRAPLRAIQGYSHLLKSRFAQEIPPAGLDYLQRMMTSAERLDKLIQDVLQYSRVSRTPIQSNSVDLEKLLSEVLSDYPNLQPPHAKIEIRKPLLPVLGNEAFLTQCISNLLSNAVKFVCPEEQPHVRVWTELRGSFVRVVFEDKGIGISAEDQKRIFNIFERVNSPNSYEGTGIGLSIVQKAVERMGGSVGVESTLGRGSKFWLQLPRGGQ